MTLKVAGQWFEIKKFSNDITLIREPYVLGGAFTNMWHIRGRDKDLLLDTGMGVLSLREHVTILREKPIVCVASHCHFDHIGGHHEFEETVIHESEAAYLESANHNDISLTDFRDNSFDALPYAGFDISTYTIQGVRPTKTVKDDDILDLGDRSLQVLHLPGHSPGSIALWEEKTGILLTGDVVTEGQLLDELLHSSKDDYLQSLARLRGIKAKIIYPGHYEPFSRIRFQQLIDEYIDGKRKPGCPTLGRSS